MSAKRWRDRAACLGQPTRLFFDAVENPETEQRRVDEVALAQCRGICLRCPVRVECYQNVMRLEGNATDERRYGVRAGTTPEQRASLYRRFSVFCPDCGETYDPMSAIHGLLVCECGEQNMHEVDDQGDRWMERHSVLASRVMLALTDRPDVPTPTALARDLDVRKDDVIRVYRALVRDGWLVEGDRRGEYRLGTNPEED